MTHSSLSAAFQQSSPALSSKKRKYPPPFSIRFTFEERARLNRDAGKLSLSAYIRLKLFGEKATSPKRLTRKKRVPRVDQPALAKALGELGKSRLASNMNQIAKAAHMGALPVTPELEQELFEACAAIKEMRGALISAIGIKDQ